MPAQHADGSVKVQRVRISRARARPLAVTILALPLTLLLLETSEYWLPDEYQKIIRSGRARSHEDKKNQQGERPTKETQDGPHPLVVGRDSHAKVRPIQQGTSIGIPLPVIRACDPVAYKETDKEWIEASKLMNDESRMAALKKVIVHETMKVWMRDKPTSNAIVRVGHARHESGISAYLDVVVPLHRPPKYQMQVLAFFPWGPQLTSMPLSNANGRRIDRILHPSVFFQAFWNAGKTFSYASYVELQNRIKRIGKESNTTSSRPSPIETVAPSSGTAPTFADKSLDVSGKADHQVMAMFRELAKTVTPEQPLAQAKMAFLRTFAAMQVQALQEIPEGAVVFQGYVTFEGRCGKVRSTISAIYLPAQDRLICPVIVERTEILPSTTWHQQSAVRAWPQAQHGQLPRLTDGEPTPEQTARYQRNVEGLAQRIKRNQAALERDISSRSKSIEASRKALGDGIQILEGKMGGKASADIKSLAAAKTYYAKGQGDDPLREFLKARSATDPYFKELLAQVRANKASPAQQKEFNSYMTEFRNVVKAQELERKRLGHDGLPAERKRLSGNEQPGATVQKQKEQGHESVEKQDQSGKTASDSIDTAPKPEERKKE